MRYITSAPSPRRAAPFAYSYPPPARSCGRPSRPASATPSASPSWSSLLSAMKLRWSGFTHMGIHKNDTSAWRRSQALKGHLSLGPHAPPGAKWCQHHPLPSPDYPAPCHCGSLPTLCCTALPHLAVFPASPPLHPLRCSGPDRCGAPPTQTAPAPPPAPSTPHPDRSSSPSCRLPLAR